MEFSKNKSSMPSKIGDKSTSDVVVRIRTQDGRDERIYCHSDILAKKSKYCSDRLSDNWPTCQILESCYCVDVDCDECDFDHHVSLLRLFYLTSEETKTEIYSVKNALGILRAAVMLQCPQVVSVSACVEYLDAVLWGDSKEEEILNNIPQMGSQAEHVLARLQPVNPSSVVSIFILAFHFATSSQTSSMNDLKTSTQEQLEYILTEDDDAPLLTADDKIKTEVKQCVNGLLERFVNLVGSLSVTKNSMPEDEKLESFQGYISDLSWASQIMAKLEFSLDLVLTWVDHSSTILKVTDDVCPDSSLQAIQLKVLEVTAKVLDAIGYGTVILPTQQRLQMVKLWLPFVRVLKSTVESVTSEDDNALAVKYDGVLFQSLVKLDDELWQSLEAAFVSIILTLPSSDQAEILKEWLGNEHIRYPDLTEAFEVWCYRSKVAKRRF